MQFFGRFVFFMLFAFAAINLFAQNNTRVSLFNGKNLQGWDTYIGPPLNDSGKIVSNIPVGLNNDPKHVFTITDDNGEKVIRISGENWGAISTVKEYADFHLQLMFKWGNCNGDKRKIKRKTADCFIFP